MRQIEKQALVPYRAAQMYALVDDIPSYPQFLPWCTAAQELERTASEVKAMLKIHKAALNTHFTTRNRLEPGTAIHMELVEGPFQTLHGEWRFTDIVDKDGGVKGSKVNLFLKFAFANPFNAWLLEPVFESTSSTLLDAFVQRARALYG